jgi:ankyrin repeat protein
MLVTEENFQGQTPLHLAARKSKILQTILHTDVFSNIFDKGDGSFRTPLMTTAIYGESESALLLVQAGADVFLKDATGRYFHDFAIEFGYLEPILRVSEHLRSQGLSKSAELLLNQSMRRAVDFLSPWELIQQLIDSDTRIDQLTELDQSLLHFAR